LTAEHQTRVRRLSEAVREELASLIANEVKDPGAVGAVVTRVEMADDLRSARVYVRLLEASDDEGRRAMLTKALERASGMLRREVTHRLGLRFAPNLRFYYDQGMDNTARVEQLLAEIEAERSRR
jgi:ribosome-binding factor A